jgi:formylglycine-generating enzyme
MTPPLPRTCAPVAFRANRLAEFVLVPPIGFSQGEFTMGNPRPPTALLRQYGQVESAYLDSTPRQVAVPGPFYIMRYPVTNVLFRRFIREREKEGAPYRTTAERKGRAWVLSNGRWGNVNGASWVQPQGPGSSAVDMPKTPVTCVSYLDAMEFASFLNEREGGEWSYRLPTELEWEFACAAGVETTAFWWGDQLDDEHCIHSCYRRRTGPEAVVRAPRPGEGRCNGWGLVDMLGNVWEWCSDVYLSPLAETGWDDAPPDRRILRGGSWGSRSAPGRMLRCFRGHERAEGRGDRIGFRLVYAGKPSHGG